MKTSKKVLVAGLLSAALCFVGTPAFATDAPGDITEVLVVSEAEVVEPDWETQPEWAFEWRDREVIEVVCKTGEPGERIVQQSMWRPSEPTWDGAEWIVHDDWREWAWPEAAQTVYRPLEPGDCDAVAAIPAEATQPARIETAVLAETGGLPVWPLAVGGSLLVGAGALTSILATRARASV